MDNKKIASMLLRVQMDDLKDADKLVDYATAIASEGDSSIASALYARAKTRLNQMNEDKRTIESVLMRAEQEAAMNGTSITTSDIYADVCKDWVESWEEKIRSKMMQFINKGKV